MLLLLQYLFPFLLVSPLFVVHSLFSPSIPTVKPTCFEENRPTPAKLREELMLKFKLISIIPPPGHSYQSKDEHVTDNIWTNEKQGEVC